MNLFDFVGNNGVGDSMDLMNVITSKIEEEVKKYMTQEETALAVPTPPNPFVNSLGAVQTIGHALTDGLG